MIHPYVQSEFDKWLKSSNARKLRKKAKEERWSPLYKNYRTQATFTNYLMRKLKKGGDEKAQAYRWYTAELKRLYPKYKDPTSRYLKPNVDTDVLKVHTKIVQKAMAMKTATKAGNVERYEKSMETLMTRFRDELGDDNSYFRNLDPYDVIEIFESISDYNAVESYGSEQVLDAVSEIMDYRNNDVEESTSTIIKEAANKYREWAENEKDVNKKDKINKFLDFMAKEVDRINDEE